MQRKSSFIALGRVLNYRLRKPLLPAIKPTHQEPNGFIIDRLHSNIIQSRRQCGWRTLSFLPDCPWREIACIGRVTGRLRLRSVARFIGHLWGLPALAKNSKGEAETCAAQIIFGAA
jgi:hypothetical protein